MRAWSVVFVACVACGGPSVDADAGAPDGGQDAAIPGPPEVTTSRGPVIGERRDGYLAFLGIPYAAPPVGELRFRAPVPPEPWTEPRPSRRPSRCVQSALGLELASSEDCLYVNVHTPDPLPEGAPVMVWMHGGGFIFGEGLQTDNGTAGDILAARFDVVVVSMNYRLGPFGFLAHAALTAEDGASGNYGIADQQLALRWVQDNIAAFGGDPANVTIFGESAGGASVCAHLVAEGREGLFAAAISQSGLCDSPLATLAEAEADGEVYATRAGCDGSSDVAACLREASLDALRAADDGGGEVFAELSRRRVWWPIVDGRVLTGDFRDRVTAGEFARVPTIIGWNRDEGTLFVMLAEQGGATVDAASYPEAVAMVAAGFGVPADDVLAQYPLDDYPDAGAALAAALGHASLACPSRRAARLLAEQGADVRVYYFTYPDAAFQLGATRDLGAFHSAEIQYVFGHPSAAGRMRFFGDDAALHDALAGYWTRFAASGDPSGGGAPGWPAYDLAADSHLVLDREIAAGSGADAEACALWEP